MQANRRRFLQAGAALAGAAALPLPRLGRAFGAASAGADPHFFVLVAIPNGMDSTYLFDARPLAMTGANLVANYLKEEPTPWTGSNGQATYATKLAAPLKPYAADFSVVNGVVMSAGFDGHTQNLNYLLTGNPFGGDSFVPQLNQYSQTPGRAMKALDYVQIGSGLFAQVNNDSSKMPLTVASAQALVKRLKTTSQLTASDKVLGYLRGRMQAQAAGDGQFAAAAGLMQRASMQAPDLDAALRGLALPAAGGDELTGDLAIMSQIFRAGITTSAVIVINPVVPNQNPQDPLPASVDTHDPSLAANSETLVGSVATQLAQVFSTLKATPYDHRRSMLDMTTIVAATEFSRTMRQSGLAIDQTGTDHDPLNNSVIIGGKGVKGGLVLGESDFRSADERLSGAHLQMDSERLKVMGRPFDFKAQRPRADLPAAYAAEDYLLFASIANTIYALYDVPAAQRWLVERNGAVAPLLTSLMA